MRKTHQLFIALILGIIANGTATYAKFTVTAEANTLPANAAVTLAKHDIDQRSSKQILVSTTEADGSLSLILQEEPGIYILKIDGQHEKTLAIAHDETVTLVASDSTLNVLGSPGTTILASYEVFRKESLKRLVYPTRANIKTAKLQKASPEEIVRLTQAEVDAYQAHLIELNDFVIENAGDTMALYGSSLRLHGDYRLPEIRTLADSFTAKHGNIAASRSLQQRIQTSMLVAIGSLAPEISAPNLSGTPEKLSDYRGRYVLVDFWASWCPPCRLENQHYAKLTTKTQGHQFTIFAVNLDTNQKAWSRAVARDNADWVHISDSRGWVSPLAATYGVNALPSSFLLDPDGRIIAKNLRGGSLDAKLRELGLL